MCWRSAALLILLGGNAVAADGFIIGIGGEGDSGGGLAGTVVADVAVAENTWLSGSIGGTTIDLPRNLSSETWYGDIGIDHWFEPVGVRLGVAYWGDRDVLESSDYRGSLYYRGDRFTLAGRLRIPRLRVHAARDRSVSRSDYHVRRRWRRTDRARRAVR